MPQATLLVVDDEPLNVSLLSQLLRPEFRVLGALSGQSALALVAAEQPDLVLLDVMMPAMDGLAVLQRMQALPAMADIPVIFVTALGAEFDEEKGLALGAADYIVKPIKPAVLLARVRAHLALRRARLRLADQNAWLEQELARRIRDGLLAQDLMLCAMAELAEREALVLQLYFDEEMNLDEIGAALGVGAARVCQIKRSALTRMRKMMEQRHGDAPLEA